MQGEIEAALSVVIGEAVQIVGAGRTDAGVHASGQVAHFDTRWMGSSVTLRRAVNAVLPRDAAVRAIGVAPPGFHARYSAVGREYRYRIWRDPVRQPLARRTTYHVPYPLDVGRMVDAAARLVGQHDFGGLGRPVGSSHVTVRRLDELTVVDRGPMLELRFVGNAFLRHQVRRTVGLLIDVGRGKWPPEVVEDVLAGRGDAPVAWRAPAWGLVLTGVRYPSLSVFTARASDRALKEGEGS